METMFDLGRQIGEDIYQVLKFSRQNHTSE